MIPNVGATVAMRVARCSEFPNDNASLHDGAIWVALEVGAAASCELPVGRVGHEIVAAYVDAVEAVEPDDEAGLVEVVDELAFEDHFDEQSHDGETDPFEAFVSVLVDV